MPEHYSRYICQCCKSLEIDGLRGDIAVSRAAFALAAFNGRSKVVAQDIRDVACLCLRHRLRKNPLTNLDYGVDFEVQSVFDYIFDPEFDSY
jgi:magnesium chelatase subunit I